MDTVKVWVPKDVNVHICRGKEVEDADHEIIPTVDLQAFLSAHILRNLALGEDIGEAKSINWESSYGWRKFLRGEKTRIRVSLRDGDVLPVSISKSRDPYGIIVHDRASLGFEPKAEE